LLDGLFDVFGGRHARDITPGKHPEKASESRKFTPAR
jgi:hypothetical protein